MKGYFTYLNILALTLISFNSFSNESVCYGTTSAGSLQNGIELPSEGNNFVSYSNVARLVGRTYVHSIVSNIIINSYAHLEKTEPKKVFKYAETGFEDGGRLVHTKLIKMVYP
jgi:penicillin-insensitive murein endopeptidase